MNSSSNKQPIEDHVPFRQPSAAKAWLKAVELTARVEAEPRRVFADVVEQWAERQPEHPALVSPDDSLGYATLAGRINQYARWTIRQGIGKAARFA